MDDGRSAYSLSAPTYPRMQGAIGATGTATPPAAQSTMAPGLMHHQHQHAVSYGSTSMAMRKPMPPSMGMTASSTSSASSMSMSSSSSSFPSRRIAGLPLQHHQHQQYEEASPRQQQHQQHQMEQIGAHLNGPALGMNMSDMDSTLRSTYQPPGGAMTHHQQSITHFAPSPTAPPSQQHESNPVSYWRPSLMEYKHGNSMDLELGEILGGSANANAQMSENDPGMNVSPATNDSSIASFEVPAFADNMNLASSASVTASGLPRSQAYDYQQLNQRAPLSATMHHHHQQHQQPMQRSPRLPGGRHPGDVAMTSPTSSTSEECQTARGMTPPDPGDYSRFVDSRDEPDLSQHKIDEKNEKCQFHNCPNRARVSQAYGKFCNRHVIVAPCGFPGCRDKAMMNSSMCDKHLAQGKEALHKILANRAQNVPVCRTFGCFKNDQGRGYCRGHEKLLMATGRLPKHINKRRLNSAYTMCSYPDCNKHSQRNHLCRTHGNMIIKQAEEIAKNSSTETYEEVLSRLQKDIRKCTHPNCTKNSQRDRLCTMHYYEKNNIQREGSSAASKDSDAAVCSIPDCNLQVFAKNMCKYHSGQGQKGPGGANAGLVGHTTEKKKCSMTGCNNQMFTSGMCAHHYKQSQIVSITSGSVDKKCEVSLCNSLAVTGSTLCEQHRGTEDESQPARLHPVNSGRMMTDSQSVMLPSSNTISSSMGGFGGSGGDGSNSERQVPSVGTIGRSFNPQGVDNDPKLAGMVSGSICGNPICQRESYGHEFCASCQSLFSPLVVSVGDCNAAASYNTGAGIPSSAPNVGYATWNDLQSSAKISDQSLQKSMVCRVKDCNASCVRGGLCLDHIRLFEDGGLSVDELAFHSRQNLGPQNEREDNKDSLRQPSPLSNSTKYFCSENGCQNPAQSKGLCQRHFRLHHDADSTLYEGDVEQSTSHSRTTHGTCHFPDCSNNLANETVLCPSHAQACFCWYPSCEKLVDGPQFCDFHAYRRQCAFEGCHYAVSEDNASSCSQHAMARRCSHEYCDKFAVEAGDRCRLHLTGCDDEPCALCEVHSLDHDGISNNNEAVSLMNLAYGKANSENVQAGNFAGNAPGEEMMEMPSLRNGRLI